MHVNPLLISTLFLLVLVLSFVFVAVIYSRRYARILGAVTNILNNDIFCKHQGGPCLMEFDRDIEMPDNIDNITFDKKIALFCADLIARIELLYYDKNGVDELVIPTGMELLTELHYNGTTIGYVVKQVVEQKNNDLPINTVCVVLRGTATASEWQKDFDYVQTENAIGDGSTVLNCHKGFLDIYSEFKNELHETLEKNEIKWDTVLITGHSLGGSLATLITLDLYKKYNTRTYVFGSPRVCDIIPEDIRYMWRVNNTSDIVPNIPLPVMPNVKNHENPYRYTHGGTSVEFTNNRSSLTNSHLLPVYLSYLKDEEGE
jgi:hypothetical protein